MNNSKGTLLVILGPTAVGKTDISLKIARGLRGEIISADSMLIYRHMNVGTAKPSLEQRDPARGGVRHHLIDIIDPDEYYSAADYGRDARKIINHLLAREIQPIMVGGSGLYVRAATEGIFEGPSMDRCLREELEAEARRKGSRHLHETMARVDPQAAARINPNDLRRIIRALEVYRLTGKPITTFFSRSKAGRAPFKPLMFCLIREKEELHRRINRRIDIMMERGWLQEVKKLLEMGYSTELVSMQSFGYKRLAACLEGEIGLEEAVGLIKRDTRRFSKRQMTWFRGMDGVKWLDLSDIQGGEDRAAEIIIEELGICANR